LSGRKEVREVLKSEVFTALVRKTVGLVEDDSIDHVIQWNNEVNKLVDTAENEVCAFDRA
jgi:hypothetical protein